MRKTVTVLKIGEDTFTQTTSILKKVTEDFSMKFKKTQVMLSSPSSFISKIIVTRLSLNERAVLDQPISFQELTEAIQKMKKGRSPGSNGYTACFFPDFSGRSLDIFCTGPLFIVLSMGEDCQHTKKG